MPYKRNCVRSGCFGGQYGRQPHLRLRKRFGMTLPSLTTLLVPPTQADLQISRPNAKHLQTHDAQGQQARQQSLISTSLQCTRRHSSQGAQLQSKASTRAKSRHSKGHGMQPPELPGSMSLRSSAVVSMALVHSCSVGTSSKATCTSVS